MKLLWSSLVVISLIGVFQFCNYSNSEGNLETSLLDQKLIQYCDLEAERGFSGVIAIKRPNQEIFYKSIGYSDKGQLIENNQNTIFDIGSLTKQFTGAAILKLEMAGKLSVEDSLIQFFPEIPEDKKGITIHHLLTHSAGFPIRIGSDFENLHKDEFIKRAFNTDLLFVPGTKFGYSHLGYSLLGVLIEKVTGTSYERFLKDNIFDPIGMSSTGYVLPAWDMSKVANGYRKCKNWRKPMDLSWGTEGPYWNLKANAGLLSTAADLMAWHTAIESNDILNDEAKSKFLFKHIRESDTSGSYYSYGWVINSSRRGTRAYAHDAGNGKFFSDWINYPQEQVSILVLMNDFRPGSRNIASELAWILFYPHHEYNTHLKTVNCFDSLPDSRIGEIAGGFINMLSSGREEDIVHLTTEYLGDYLKKKYSNDIIFHEFQRVQKDAGPSRISNIIIIGNDYMEIKLNRIADEAKIEVRIKFDKEDDYKIRRFMYNSNEP
ncbi:MAG: serine hydrolase domain-containing protein [Bacteroidota bacterium]|nr:serine hydrolase domain-containing protein [Bacteroidota bacterium]